MAKQCNVLRTHMIGRALVLALMLATTTTVGGQTGSVVKIDHSFELIDYDPGIEGSTHHSASRWVLVLSLIHISEPTRPY